MQVISTAGLNNDVGAALQAASADPAIITQQGHPSHVLMTIDDYERIMKPVATWSSWFQSTRS